MVSAKKSNKPKYNLLSDTTLSGSNDAISFILIHALQAYKKREITLASLTKLAAKITQQKSTALTGETRDIVEEIKSYAIIEDALTDMLSELIEKTGRKRNIEKSY